MDVCSRILPGRCAGSHRPCVRSLHVFVPHFGFTCCQRQRASYPHASRAALVTALAVHLLWEGCGTLQPAWLVPPKQALPDPSNFCSPSSRIFRPCHLGPRHSDPSWRLPLILLYYRQKGKSVLLIKRNAETHVCCIFHPEFLSNIAKIRIGRKGKCRL